MNERIKQLKEQARDFYLLQEDLDCSIKELHELVDTKFAELILWELIDKISQEQDIAEQNWQCKNGVHICHKLTEHFGVKE